MGRGHYERTKKVKDIPCDKCGKLFAYDKATGGIVWETDLPAGSSGGPMTYLHDGKQYIVVPIGARERPAEWVALALR